MIECQVILPAFGSWGTRYAVIDVAHFCRDRGKKAPSFARRTAEGGCPQMGVRGYQS
jgi:hypothetical protein